MFREMIAVTRKAGRLPGLSSLSASLWVGGDLWTSEKAPGSNSRFCLNEAGDNKFLAEPVTEATDICTNFQRAPRGCAARCAEEASPFREEAFLVGLCPCALGSIAMCDGSTSIIFIASNCRGVAHTEKQMSGRAQPLPHIWRHSHKKYASTTLQHKCRRVRLNKQFCLNDSK